MLKKLIKHEFKDTMRLFYSNVWIHRCFNTYFQLDDVFGLTTV